MSCGGILGTQQNPPPNPKSLVTLLHAQAGIGTWVVLRDSQQSVATPQTTQPSGQALPLDWNINKLPTGREKMDLFRFSTYWDLNWYLIKTTVLKATIKCWTLRGIDWNIFLFRIMKIFVFHFFKHSVFTIMYLNVKNFKVKVEGQRALTPWPLTLTLAIPVSVAFYWLSLPIGKFWKFHYSLILLKVFAGSFLTLSSYYTYSSRIRTLNIAFLRDSILPFCKTLARGFGTWM